MNYYRRSAAVKEARHQVQIQTGDHPLTARIQELLQLVDTTNIPDVMVAAFKELQTIVPQLMKIRSKRQGRLTAGVLIQNTDTWKQAEQLYSYLERTGRDEFLPLFDQLLEGDSYVVK